MEFRLTYAGELRGQKSAKPDHIHQIRKQFHQQLSRLWDIHPLLKAPDHALVFLPGWHHSDGQPEIITKASKGKDVGRVGLPFQLSGTGWHRVSGISLRDYLTEKYPFGEFRFAPLVRPELALLTSLHILFLRRERPGAVLKSADIDSRLKTLFDALQIPQIGQLTSAHKPDEGETPFFVLLENDELITNVSVETDMLLQPVNDNEHDARLVITVKLHPYEHNAGNEGFA